MLVCFHLVDAPGMTDKRAEIRPEHLEYLGTKKDDILCAGPLIADDGETSIGSMMVIDFPSVEAARAWISEEPFTKAGVYDMQKITLWKSVFQPGANVAGAAAA